jgi:hypothetical protein
MMSGVRENPVPPTFFQTKPSPDPSGERRKKRNEGEKKGKEKS